jgi:hypothetical protein
VGTGSTEAEIMSVLGSTPRHVNIYDATLSSLEYQRDSWDFMMVFSFADGICNDIVMITSE